MSCKSMRPPGHAEDPSLTPAHGSALAAAASAFAAAFRSSVTDGTVAVCHGRGPADFAADSCVIAEHPATNDRLDAVSKA